MVDTFFLHLGFADDAFLRKLVTGRPLEGSEVQNMPLLVLLQAFHVALQQHDHFTCFDRVPLAFDLLDDPLRPAGQLGLCGGKEHTFDAKRLTLTLRLAGPQGIGAAQN